MKKVRLRLKKDSYDILIGRKILAKAGSEIKKLNIGKDAIVITNKHINKLYGRKLISGLKKSGFSVKVFEVPDSEKSKSTDTAINLLECIAKDDVKRKIFLVAFGGGVVGDLAGFVSSIYKRGVPYVQIPTTFLAQIDSSIGGKTAVDLFVGKNLVGTFYQPKLVLSDVSLLSTLNKRQIRNGLSEAVKYSVIRDKKLFNFIEKNNKKLLSADTKALENVIVKCSNIKADVVSNDEKETKGIRTILNFGHTLGHAVEAAGAYSLYHHGEAVALGMRIAVSISKELGLCPEEECLRIERLLSDIGLPKRIRKAKLSHMIKIMSHDKKFKSGKNRFVLLVKIGKVRVIEGISQEVIKKAVKSYL